MVMPSTSLPTRPLKRSTMPLVWGERGRVWRCFAPRSAQTLAERGGEQLPLSASTWGRREGEGGAARRGEGRGPLSVSSSFSCQPPSSGPGRILVEHGGGRR